MITTISSPVNFRLPKLHSPKSSRTRCPCFKVFSAVGTSSPAEDDVLQAFLVERELTGDLIAKISDKIWIKQSALKLNHNSENRGMADVVNSSNAMQLAQKEEDESGGFLKLKKTNEWILGDTESAPVNKKMTDKEIRNDSEKRRRINLLKYEALKRELLLLTVGIGTNGGGYCLVVFSFELFIPSTVMEIHGQLFKRSSSSYFHEEKIKEIWDKK